jgi:adenylate cyclase
MAEVQRRLAAILAADVVGFSAMMERAEEATYTEINRLRQEVIAPSLARHQGRLIKSTGDGVLAEFASPLAAAKCAMEIQQRLSSSPDGIRLRIGLNLGDVIVQEDGDVYGEGINIAARLEGLADPGGILVSAKVHDEIAGKLDAAFEDRGERQLKNISRPIRTYALASSSGWPNSAVSKAVQSAGEPPLPDKPSIAVLPFQNMSGDPEQEYFADGMVEDIITALSRFNSLFVIARNSSFTYKGKAVDIKKVGRELGVRYVLEGSVRKAGGRVRITGQLIEAATGTHLWADKIDGDLDDVFELQDRITADVVSSIAPKIEQAEIERVKQKPTNTTDSYDSYLRGTALHNRGRFAEARSLFKKAVEQDSGHAAAYAMAAFTYLAAQAQKGVMTTPEMRADALRDANAALRLTNDDAFVLARCANVLTYLGPEYDRGASLVERAVALNPNLSAAWLARCWISVMRAEPERGIESFEKMMRLSPLDPLRPFLVTGVANCYWYQGRFKEGRVLAKEIMLLHPHLQSYASYIVNCVGAGDVTEAKKAAIQLMEVEPAFRISRAAEIFLIRSPDYREKFDHALRTAGLPE